MTIIVASIWEERVYYGRREDQTILELVSMK